MEERGDGQNRRSTAGKGVDIYKMSFGGENYTSHSKTHKRFLILKKWAKTEIDTYYKKAVYVMFTQVP